MSSWGFPFASGYRLTVAHRKGVPRRSHPWPFTPGRLPWPDPGRISGFALGRRRSCIASGSPHFPAAQNGPGQELVEAPLRAEYGQDQRLEGKPRDVNGAPRARAMRDLDGVPSRSPHHKRSDRGEMDKNSQMTVLRAGTNEWVCIPRRAEHHRYHGHVP